MRKTVEQASLRSSSLAEERCRPGAQHRALPELLAPAGDWECARAAVENGADAIYFGLERFNARMRAHNFTEADLPKLLEYLHRRGVRGYLTFNTLVFENEVPEAMQYLRSVIAAGVDAAIVQDVGMCRLIRQLSPDFPIHVSTQMTITSAAGMEFARRLGCNLVVLARECSLKEIEKIQAAQFEGTSAGPPPMPLEVFVHGALCVAYSGQCLTSEALGGRSANRGECAQACRLPYTLLSDGKEIPLGDRRYLLSPQDLAGLELLPELARLRVASLKIEGRLKSPEYVANITRIYRQALDRLASEPGLQTGEDARPGARLAASATDRYEMEMAFSRGLYTGWFDGTNNQALVHGRFGTKRGVYLGTVAEVRKEGVVLRLEAPLKPGDGVVFDAGRPEGKEEGGRVFEVHPVRAAPLPGSGRPGNGGFSLLTFGWGHLDLRQVRPGNKVWKTSDPELEKRLRRSFAGDAPKYQRPVVFEAHGGVGRPMTVVARDDLGHVARADSAMPLASAETQPLTRERLEGQLGRLGGTPFFLEEVRCELAGEVMLPVSELNRLRREVVTELEAQRTRPLRWTLNPEPLVESPARVAPPPAVPAADPELIVLIRTLSQLEAAMSWGAKTLYCDFEDPKKYRQAVGAFRAAGLAGGSIWVAPPRVFKTGEDWTLTQTRSCDADGYLIRNYDHLRFFAGDRKRGDYSLNVANRFAAEYFRSEFGLERLTASYDLNPSELEALLTGAPAEWFEVTIHQHMPMFHMEHCLFCAFLTTGTDYTNCGRPCDRNELKLKDRVGAEHPVKADAGCRNTVFNAVAQTGAELVGRLLTLGARHFRVEFVNESPAQVTQTLSKYRQLLRGEITGQQLWRELRLMNQLGVTRGRKG